jgi:hypothetical protein
MATPTPAPTRRPPRWGGVLLAGLLLVAAAIVFYLVYVLLPRHDHFSGLLGIGILSLVFSLGTYLGESLSREPIAQRVLAWAFFGLGFSVLFLTLAVGTMYGAISMLWQLAGLLITVVVLMVTVALIYWRTAALQRTAKREVARHEWDEEPAPSAFSYATAGSPDVPTVPVTPAPPPSQSPPAGRS